MKLIHVKSARYQVSINQPEKPLPGKYKDKAGNIWYLRDVRESRDVILWGPEVQGPVWVADLCPDCTFTGLSYDMELIYCWSNNEIIERREKLYELFGVSSTVDEINGETVLKIKYGSVKFRSDPVPEQIFGMKIIVSD